MALAWKAGWVQALAGSNPASSAPPTGETPPDLTGPGGGSVAIVSVLVSVGSSGRSVYPEEAADPVGNLTPNGIGYVLIARSHRRPRPAHDAHDCPLRHPQDQEHSCGRMTGVVQACFLARRPASTAPSSA